MTPTVQSAAPPRDLLVSECFGPTFQGEGASSGRRALFLRLATCNLCCGWCDTPFTWDWSRFDHGAETSRASVADLVTWATSSTATLVVVTGGEPLLQRDGLADLVTSLTAAGKRVEIETNGTLVPGPALATSTAQFNVGIKLANSGMREDRRVRPDAIRTFAETTACVWKFVVRDLADLDEISGLEARFGLAPIWMMPEGTNAESTLAVMRSLADEVLARGWNLTPRLHILLWGDARGR
ncbi:7-carboxy-7-deazaguanine synthase QueE [Frankia sp. CNm7]|uniref:7-carboxy-7-deazaguanine synthase n=1 Tax=Frankia nepalensis TaxID=1836974 RepID=A0A937UUF5_9ACTN|nr:7-carboxy-7-deazaguanine synthase QueE [Frankia nepalensis]MBL7499289.1 7-carboxy-7-deazaguanine synthase QueE [Frankia nepalensis]MBL7512363.1 7-carboxy-7-deazaguanine synthase QueE [Frankia nepalensis]MBL7522574.1 7-carboxy-7-deazaguanine synthase QueE [Frankia nepalensis]MBL7632205.1 7-carboxy-7-deazaguanine synthase QueE [Frankia nepalensis]